MLFPLRKLLAGRDVPTSVDPTDTLQKALALMIGSDFSQLSIVDKQGHFLGFVTEQSIAQGSYHLGDKAFKLSYAVREFMEDAPTFSLDDDLFDILEAMKTSYAIAVLDDEERLAGIVTYYDTGAFFRAYSEGMMHVQDIELSLRDYMDALVPAGLARHGAFERLKVNGYTIHHPNKLTFDNLIKIIEEEWTVFEPYFSPQEMFVALMGRVRDIRNDLAHFGNDTDAVAMNALRHAVQWIENRPSLPNVAQAQQVQVSDNVTASEIINVRKQGGNKYDALKQWLQNQTGTTMRVSFEDIERIIGAQLPPSARSTRNWWANDSVSRVQSIAWLNAGWRVIGVNLAEQRATFQRSGQGG